jgi:hypothetical protein
MKETFKAEEIEVGYHPKGFRIDRATSPLNRYTRWEVTPEGEWVNPKPVSFHAMPEDGWLKAKGFDWDE